MRFSNEEELEKILYQLCNDIFEQYAKPLWENPIKLQALIEEQDSERLLEGEKDLRKQYTNKAKHAYESGRYEEALKLYEKIGVDKLTAAERRAYYICRKHIKAEE